MTKLGAMNFSIKYFQTFTNAYKRKQIIPNRISFVVESKFVVLK